MTEKYESLTPDAFPVKAEIFTRIVNRIKVLRRSFPKNHQKMYDSFTDELDRNLLITLNLFDLASPSPIDQTTFSRRCRIVSAHDRLGRSISPIFKQSKYGKFLFDVSYVSSEHSFLDKIFDRATKVNRMIFENYPAECKVKKLVETIIEPLFHPLYKSMGPPCFFHQASQASFPFI